MEIDQHPDILVQKTLFDEGDSTSGTLELIPRLWYVAESLSSPSAELRRDALKSINQENAARLSPLLAYIVFTRLSDPDLDIRKMVVNTLANVLRPDDGGLAAPEEVRLHLYAHLTEMNLDQVKELLEIAIYEPESEQDIEILLKAGTYSGDHLSKILADRKNNLNIREISATFIGRIGYLDAEATLDRIANRLESKMKGQKVMPFTRMEENDEKLLLPSVRLALEYLRAP